MFLRSQLLGAITLGAGPAYAHSLVEGAGQDDGLTLTRLWLSDQLPINSESRVLGILIRSLRRHTTLKFLIAYADPTQGHLGIIYQAAGWLYTGLSVAMPQYDLGDGVARHSRSVAQIFGSHSLRRFHENGVRVRLTNQSAKHRYVYFLDSAWRSRLNVKTLPYPKKKEPEHANNRYTP